MHDMRMQASGTCIACDAELLDTLGKVCQPIALLLQDVLNVSDGLDVLLHAMSLTPELRRLVCQYSLSELVYHGPLIPANPSISL